MQYPTKELLAKEWEFIKLSMSYLSIIVTSVSLAFVTVLFAGNINQAHLDGVGLANTIFNVVVMSVSSGYSSVFDTYGPQVYGSSEPGELATVLVKCLLQGGMIHLTILGPYLNLVYVIRMLPNSGLYPTVNAGSETAMEDFRDLAVKYLRMTLIVEFLDYAVTMMLRYFAIQGQNKIVYAVSLVMATVHILANYLLVSVLGLGVEGLGLAAISGRTLALIVSVGICVVNIKKGLFPWKGMNMRVLLGWKPMIKLGVSGAINVFAEVALYEISTFCSQFASTTTLSVIIIYIQIMSVWWATSFAISRTAATLIGKALVEGSVIRVKQYMLLTLINTLLEAVPTAVISYFFREYLVRIFQDDPDVIDAFTSVTWLACIGLILTHLQTSLNQGVLIAFGAQRFTALTMSMSCYLVGLPLIIMTIFLTNLGVTGIFLGWMTSDTIILIAAVIKIWKTDILEEIEKSRRRVANMDKTVEAFENPAYNVTEGDVKFRTESKVADQDANIKELLNEDSVSTQLFENATFGQNVHNNQEIRIVVITFVTLAVFCVTSASISLIGG
ncbi:hypothetical protein ACHWQZ_G008565 [Mnemiopsis leidyi]